MAEFAAANTWSMMLIIGNPTNIYLATSAGIDFTEYYRTFGRAKLSIGVRFILVYICHTLYHYVFPYAQTPASGR